MHSVYVVIGTTGEYSDRSEWLVQAFEDSFAASMLVFRLEAVYKYHADKPDYARMWQDSHCEDSHEQMLIDLHKLDPLASVDYTGLRYSVTEVPFTGQYVATTDQNAED